MEEKKNQTLTDKIWNLFSSIKLAVVIFALIAITSIIGTIIEQNTAPEKNIKLIGKLFGDSIAPALYNAFDFFRFYGYVPLMVVCCAAYALCCKSHGLFH